MDIAEAQRLIDEVPWYHEFVFPNGLHATSTSPDAEAHRTIWQFIERSLDRIDFKGKTVLDLGCWDGYWSFYAERRGARHVLATDDRTQNWAGSAGLMLAHELLGSKVEARLDVSVYDLMGLGQFDIVLCMGIWYHLTDPFYAFAQVRQCCHRDSLVVFEGDILRNGPSQAIHYDLSNNAMPVFVPDIKSLTQMWKACYFDVESEASLIDQMMPPPRYRSAFRKKARQIGKALIDAAKNPPGLIRGIPLLTDRLIAVCKPVTVADNPLHPYRPPFGLHVYDDRFRR